MPVKKRPASKPKTKPRKVPEKTLGNAGKFYGRFVARVWKAIKDAEAAAELAEKAGNLAEAKMHLAEVKRLRAVRDDLRKRALYGLTKEQRAIFNVEKNKQRKYLIQKHTEPEYRSRPEVKKRKKRQKEERKNADPAGYFLGVMIGSGSIKAGSPEARVAETFIRTRNRKEYREAAGELMSMIDSPDFDILDVRPLETLLKHSFLKDKKTREIIGSWKLSRVERRNRRSSILFKIKGREGSKLKDLAYEFTETLDPARYYEIARQLIVGLTKPQIAKTLNALVDISRLKDAKTIELIDSFLEKRKEYSRKQSTDGYYLRHKPMISIEAMRKKGTISNKTAETTKKLLEANEPDKRTSLLKQLTANIKSKRPKSSKTLRAILKWAELSYEERAYMEAALSLSPAASQAWKKVISPSNVLKRLSTIRMALQFDTSLWALKSQRRQAVKLISAINLEIGELQQPKGSKQQPKRLAGLKDVQARANGLISEIDRMLKLRREQGKR